MKNGNFEMDDEEYMEALDLRDEYSYAYKLNHNNPWWNEFALCNQNESKRERRLQCYSVSIAKY